METSALSGKISLKSLCEPFTTTATESLASLGPIELAKSKPLLLAGSSLLEPSGSLITIFPIPFFH